MNSEVLVKFKGDSSDLDKTTGKASGALKGFASGVATFFKGATVAIGVTATAIGAIVKKSVEAYAEFEQLEGGLESLFGKGSQETQKILKDSENAYKTLTMSQNEYLNAFQSAYPLINAGLSENADGILYTNKVLQLSSDLFNTYGGSVEQYQNAINWALKGTYSYLDNLNLGIKGTQEGFIEAANSSGILGREIKNVSELTSDEIVDVIQHYAEAYGVWGKTAEEAGKTIQGSLNMTKSAWSNFITGLSKDGADINGLIDNLVKSAMTFGKNILPVIMRALSGIAKALPTIANSIAQMLPGLVNSIIPPLIESINVVINTLINILPGLIDTLAPLLAKTIVSLIKSLAKIIPKLTKSLVTGLTKIFEELTKALPTLIPIIIKSLVSAIQIIAQQIPVLLPIIVDAVINGILAILDNIDVIIDAGIECILALIEGLTDPNTLAKIITAIPIIIVKIVEAIIKNLPKIIAAGGRILYALGEGIISLIGKLDEWLHTIIDKIISVLGKLGSMAIQWGINMMVGFINGIKSFINSVVNVGKSIMTGLINGIKSFMNSVINVGRSVINNIINVFRSLPGNMLNIGRNIMQGLWNGIVGLKNWVVSKVKALGSSILNGLKKALGIHSPSTEFAIVGKFSMLGYEEGLEKMQPQIQKTINGLFDLQPSINGSMSNTLSPNINVQNNINMETDPIGQIVGKVKTFSGGSKNDYNWGAGI